jgi:tetratricopeptide (TPR) repeat protein
VDIVFGILGRTALRIDDDLDEAWGSTRLRAMLATLLVHAGRAVPISTLLAWIWPDDGSIPQNPASTLYTYATRIRTSLRRLPEPPALHVENGYYRLEVDKSLIDYERFRVSVGQARVHARAGSHREAVDWAARALALWRGPALEDLTSEPARAWRTRVRWDEWIPANVIHIEALLGLDEFEEALTRLDDLKTDYGHDVMLAKLRLAALYGLSRFAEATAYYLGMRRQFLDDADEQSAGDLRDYHESLRERSAPVEPGPPREPMVVPRQLPRDIPEFVGRDNLLEALDRATQDNGSDGPSRVLVLDGMAGVGKTALVVHWGHRARHRFPGGDFFVDLRGFSDGVSITQSAVVDEFLVALGRPPSGDLSPRARELLLKRLLADRRALVVLDNARNTAHVTDLVALLPSCSIVVTSRQQLTKLRAMTGARRVHVDPMTSTEATDLLSVRLGDLHDVDPHDRTRLAILCGGLPLVITVLAQHLASRPAVHLAAFAHQLDRRQLLTDVGEDGDGSSTAETLFYWSYQALGAAEQRLFRLLGVNPGRDIGEAAARACDGRSMADVKRSLRVLVAAHLLDQPDEFDRYRFHDLILEFARHRIEIDDNVDTRVAAERRLLDHYLSAATQAHRTLYPGNLIAAEVVSGDTSETAVFAGGDVAKTWFERERENLVAAIRLAARRGYHEHAWRLTDTVGTFLDRQGYYEYSRTVRELSVDSARAVGDHVGEASSLVGLGMVQMILGDHTDARISLEAALLLVDAEGIERGQASTLHQLGRLEFARGNLAEAVRFYRRCLEIAQRTQDSEALCWTHCSIAETLRILDQHDEALTHLREAQIHAQQAEDDSAYASSMIEIGSIHRDRGDHAGAVAHCEQALEIVEAMPIPDLAIMTSACIALAEIENERRSTESATGYILRAVELARRTRNTTAEARAHEVYGDIQFAAGEPVHAVSAWQFAVERYEHIDNVRRVTTIQHKIIDASGERRDFPTDTGRSASASGRGTPALR